MPNRLLYHHPDKIDQISPFDEALIAVAGEQGPIRLACPYLSLSYLQRVIRSNRSWRLLTDVDEWLNCHNRAERKRIYQFMVNNSNSIRHVSKLHAKVAVGTKSAMIGSANFTYMGIRQRHEMGMYIDDQTRIDELAAWFDMLWINARELPLKEISDYCDQLPDEAVIEEDAVSDLFPEDTTVHSNLVPLAEITDTEEQIADDEAAEHRMVQRLGVFKDCKLLESYLSTVKTMLSELEIKNSDQRLSMTIPKSNKIWPLPVSINFRYVIAPRVIPGEDLSVAIIYGADFEQQAHLRNRISNFWRFGALPGEKESDRPFLLHMRSIDEILHDKELMTGWLAAARREFDRARSSSFRRFHEPVFYRLAVDQDYRQLILNKVFV